MPSASEAVRVLPKSGAGGDLRGFGVVHRPGLLASSGFAGATSDHSGSVGIWGLLPAQSVAVRYRTRHRHAHIVACR